MRQSPEEYNKFLSLLTVYQKSMRLPGLLLPSTGLFSSAQMVELAGYMYLRGASKSAINYGAPQFIALLPSAFVRYKLEEALVNA
jgi:ABC-type transport system involved in cytochrome bd biosynthesis fused ATPase/permease subunit